MEQPNIYLTYQTLNLTLHIMISNSKILKIELKYERMKKERKEDFVIQKQLEYNERPVNLFWELECKRTDLGDTDILLHH